MKKYKRHARRKRNELDHGLIITSMVDMFTLVLLFLLVFYDPSYGGDASMELPHASIEHAVEKGPSVRVTPEAVTVEGKSVLRLANGLVGADVARSGPAVVPVVEALTALKSTNAPPSVDAEPVLLVECDRRVAWSVLRAVLDSASQAGYPRYRFVVLGGD